MAASIIISSGDIHIAETKRDYVFLNSAEVSYQCQASWSGQSEDDEEPEVSAGTHTWYNYNYSNLSYNWSFTPSTDENVTGNQGSVSIGSLTAKQSNTITATLTVSGTETITVYTRTDTAYSAYYDPELPPQGDMSDGDYQLMIDRGLRDGTYTYYPAGVNEGETLYDYIVSNPPISAKKTYTITVWTRPGVFSAFADIQANDLIQDYLTTTNITNWKDHCNAFAHWWNQNNTDTAGSTCSIPADRIIYASWYNNCCDACADANTRPAHVVGGPNGTIITPGLFLALGAAISKDDNT